MSSVCFVHQMRRAGALRRGDQALAGIDAVHNRVDAVQRRIEPIAGLHVADDVLNVGGLVRPPSAAQNADILARGRKMVDDDAPDGAGAARYQDSCGHTL